MDIFLIFIRDILYIKTYIYSHKSLLREKTANKLSWDIWGQVSFIIEFAWK